MDTSVQLQSHWAQMAANLWGTIFQHLKTKDRLDPTKESVMCKLPLVCRKFREVLVQQPQLSITSKSAGSFWPMRLSMQLLGHVAIEASLISTQTTSVGGHSIYWLHCFHTRSP